MAGEVTREELRAMVEVQSKNVEQLTVIANHLSTIVERENKIYDRLYNGMSKEITSVIVDVMEKNCNKVLSVVEKTKETQTGQCAAANPILASTIAAQLSSSSMATDIKHAKWFIGAVGLITIVVSLVVNTLTRQGSQNEFMHEFQQSFKQFTEQIVSHKEVAKEVTSHTHEDVKK